VTPCYLSIWLLVDLGEHRLKDLGRPVRLYQLGEGEFPPLRSLNQTNLPVSATPFLGREAELADVRALLTQEQVRLLTLTGAGGSGKTRLALQAAGEAADDYPHGVWWVPLAPVSDARDVMSAAARALGADGPLAEVVGERRLLLLLDNFEHVVHAASEVAALLTMCPRLNVIVTSRERLRVQGEQVYPVPVLSRRDAHELFVARACAAQPGFTANGHVDELCARLDDLPLALELAAARTSLLTTEQLLQRLGSRLDLLRGGRDSEVRQRTLRATIEWSYELLNPEEQGLLTALSIFRGGWTFEAAERVCSADLELLELLVDKSLVRRWESGRFGMLETVREFAAEQLAPERRHELARRLLDQLVETFEAEHLRPESPGAPRMDLAQAERPNVDVALQWALDSRAPEAGLRLLWMLEMYWATNDPAGGRERLDSLVAAAGDGLDPSLRARALRLRGATFDVTGRFDLSEAEYLRARELFRVAGDDQQDRHLAHRIAASAVQAGDPERGARLARKELAVDGERGDRLGETVALSILSWAAFAQGDRDDAVRLAYESAAIAQEVDFTWWHGVTLLGPTESACARRRAGRGRPGLPSRSREPRVRARPGQPSDRARDGCGDRGGTRRRRARGHFVGRRRDRRRARAQADDGAGAPRVLAASRACPRRRVRARPRVRTHSVARRGGRLCARRCLSSNRRRHPCCSRTIEGSARFTAAPGAYLGHQASPTRVQVRRRCRA
jgi:predicted ATPase